jgi:PAS domain S-box-containing protein
MKMQLAERIEAGLRAGHLSWWEMELPSGRVAFDDQKALMLGYAPEQFETYHDFTELVHPEDREVAMRAMSDHLAGACDRYEVEYRIATSDGSYRWFRDIGAITERDEATEYMRVIGIVEDITDRKEAQLQLQEALEARDRLMRELNHRVKNNLHLVSSLITLKERALNDSVDLSDLRHQITTIATIHEKLYQTDSIDVIDFGKYAHDLLRSIFSFYPGKTVEIDNQIRETVLSPDRSVTLGLILNELATNAIKHGFVGGETNRFSVRLKMDKGDYVLEVANSGNRFPSDMRLDNPETMGLQLIDALAGQLEATVDVRREPETTFVLRFPQE